MYAYILHGSRKLRSLDAFRHTCIYIHIYICIYVYVYIYIYIYIQIVVFHTEHNSRLLGYCSFIIDIDEQN